MLSSVVSQTQLLFYVLNLVAIFGAVLHLVTTKWKEQIHRKRVLFPHGVFFNASKGSFLLVADFLLCENVNPSWLKLLLFGCSYVLFLEARSSPDTTSYHMFMGCFIIFF